MLLRVRVLLVLFVCGALLWPGLAQNATAQSDPAQRSLDLPAMLPVPDELPTPGFSIWRGQLYNQRARAVSWAARDGRDVEAIVRDLQEVGWLQSYEATFVVAGDDPALTDHAVMIAITEYADETVATKQLSIELSLPLSETMSDVPDAPVVGDASATRKLVDVAPPGVDVSNGTFQGVQLVFQASNVIARVIPMDRGATPVDPAQAATIAETLLTQIQEVKRKGGPDLSGLLLRYEGAGDGTLEHYSRLDGAPRRSADQDDEEFADRVSNTGKTIDTYEYEPAFEDAFLIVGLATFPDAESASATLDELVEEFTTDLEEGVTAVVGGRAFGDESRTVSIDYQGIAIYAIAVRLDTKAIGLLLGGEDIGLSAAEEMVAAQLKCVQTASCTEAVPLPVELQA